MNKIEVFNEILREAKQQYIKGQYLKIIPLDTEKDWDEYDISRIKKWGRLFAETARILADSKELHDLGFYKIDLSDPQIIQLESHRKHRSYGPLVNDEFSFEPDYDWSNDRVHYWMGNAWKTDKPITLPDELDSARTYKQQAKILANSLIEIILKIAKIGYGERDNSQETWVITPTRAALAEYRRETGGFGDPDDEKGIWLRAMLRDHGTPKDCDYNEGDYDLELVGVTKEDIEEWMEDEGLRGYIKCKKQI